ncbi:hypothetical protein RJT34_01643 [Clitoria ternatea]|uniref:Uncharacterized protein n=1 Tax=Clitoria ternatea TaxID=43366 RepID=A0AAN9KJQ0_CLITE
MDRVCGQNWRPCALSEFHTGSMSQVSCHAHMVPPRTLIPAYSVAVRWYALWAYTCLRAFYFPCVLGVVVCAWSCSIRISFASDT